MKLIIVYIVICVLLMMAAVCGCSKDKTTQSTPSSETLNSDTQPIEPTYDYSYVTPLKEPKVESGSSHVELSTKEVFNICKYIVRGKVVDIQELKTTKHTAGGDTESYCSVVMLAVKESMGSGITEENIEILYPSCSYDSRKDCVQLKKGNYYIFMLNDTTVTSTKKGIEEYAPYSSLYTSYTVLSKKENGYDARAFMTQVMGIAEKDVKESYTLKEIRKTIEPYLDELKGMPVSEVLKQRKK